MKKNIIIVILIMILTIVIGIFFYFFFKQEETDAIRFSKEYEITKENVFVYKNSTEIINILKHGTGVVYLGFPECPWCKAYAEILNEAAKENDIKKIYYFNILQDRKNNTTDYQKIVSLLNDNLAYDEEGNKKIYVPDVTIIIDGKIIGHNNETSMITSDITPTEYWTEDAKQKLKIELKTYLEQIQKSTCSDICDR